MCTCVSHPLRSMSVLYLYASNSPGVRAAHVLTVSAHFVFQSVNMDVVMRMYLALVLFTLLKETNLWSVADKFQLSRGFIQTLLSSASAFCSSVLHFTEVPASLSCDLNCHHLG